VLIILFTNLLLCKQLYLLPYPWEVGNWDLYPRLLVVFVELFNVRLFGFWFYMSGGGCIGDI
jgi:Tfp pilus assembly protein PilO